jgi:hypothetical protein
MTLRESGESIAGSETERILQKQLAHLDEGDKEAVRQLALGIGRKASKLPLRGIRAMIAACKDKSKGAGCIDKLHETVTGGGQTK